MRILNCPSCGAKSFSKKDDTYVCKYCASEILSDHYEKEETTSISIKGLYAFSLLSAIAVGYVVYTYSYAPLPLTPPASKQIPALPKKTVKHRSVVVTSKSWSYFAKSKKPFILKSASVDHVTGKYIFCGKEGNKEYEKYFSGTGKRIGEKSVLCHKNLDKKIPYLNGELSVADKVNNGSNTYIVLTYKDKIGNVLWTKRFKSTGEDTISHIMTGINDVVLLVGYTVSTLAPVQYSWIIQLPDDIENSSFQRTLNNISF